MLGNNVAMYGFKGTQAFVGKPVKDAQAVAALYLESIQHVVVANSSIKGLAGLKGKRVAVGSPASGTQIASELILPILDLKKSDIKALQDEV